MARLFGSCQEHFPGLLCKLILIGHGGDCVRTWRWFPNTTAVFELAGGLASRGRWVNDRQRGRKILNAVVWVELFSSTFVEKKGANYFYFASSAPSPSMYILPQRRNNLFQFCVKPDVCAGGAIYLSYGPSLGCAGKTV